MPSVERERIAGVTQRTCLCHGAGGLAGICDAQQQLCLALALALHNGKDRILEERIFGLTDHEGNHGEDAKECDVPVGNGSADRWGAYSNDTRTMPSHGSIR